MQMKRLASCANELKEMASDMDSTNPGVQPVTNEVASKVSVVSLVRSLCCFLSLFLLLNIKVIIV